MTTGSSLTSKTVLGAMSCRLTSVSLDSDTGYQLGKAGNCHIGWVKFTKKFIADLN